MKTIVALAVLFAVNLAVPAAEDKPESPPHSIVLSTGQGSFVFPKSVPLKVSYRNMGKDPWVVETPKESARVRLKYRPRGSDGIPNGYSLGRIIILTNGLTISREYPTPKPVSIVLGQSHDFEIPFPREWFQALTPGVWSVWIEDESEGGTNALVSNRVEVQRRFTAESVTNCLEVAIDAEKKRKTSTRSDHAVWLTRIMPGLKLRWWTNQTPAPERDRRELEVQRQLKAFREYWENPTNAQAIAAAIDKIDREAEVRTRRYIERGVDWDSDANWPTNAPPPITNSLPVIGHP